MDSKKLYRLFYSKYHTSVLLNENNEELTKSQMKDMFSELLPEKYTEPISDTNQAKIWQHCGVEQDFKKDFVQQSINEYFVEDELYLIITSGNSSLVKKSIIADEIGKFINKKQIGIMNESCEKIMWFQTFNKIGVFAKGVVKEYPKSREKKKGEPLEVNFNANMYESSTKEISHNLSNLFEKLEEKLNKDYGGNMEHLWIDVELIKHYSALPFRFQKRVNIASGVGGKDYYYNVGNYSIKPDFIKLETLDDKESLEYIFNLLYVSMEILVKKKKKLDNFDAEKFRADFKTVCYELGYTIK